MEPVIDIEGKRLAYSAKDVAKLNSEEGCKLDVITDKVYYLEDDDENLSFSSDENSESDLDSKFSPNAKLDRVKREFIALTTNANRDPIKRDELKTLRNMLMNSEPPNRDEKNVEEKKDEKTKKELDENSDFILKGRNFEPLRDDHSIIHRRFEKSRFNFEELLMDGKNNFEDISSPLGGRVFKKIIQPGYGPRLTEASLIVYNCACWTEGQREPYDSTWLRRNTYISDLTNDSILPGIHELLLTTRKGEWCEALIKPEAAFGKLGVKPRIPGNAIIYCLIEVVNIIEKDKISILAYNPQSAQSENKISFEEFFAVSNEARQRGNYYFENKQYRIALNRYKSGIRILEGLTYKNAEEEKKAKSLLLRLYNNVAHASNELGLPRLALSACKQASLIDDFHPKTYWYRLQAWKLKGHPDLALNVARRAATLFKGDSMAIKYFKKEEEELKAKINQQRIELDNLHRLMGKAAIAS